MAAAGTALTLELARRGPRLAPSLRPLLPELDPARDHEAMVRFHVMWEFPFDIERATELALFSTYASPSISGLLADTGEFSERGLRRFDDTALLLAEILENGLDSPRARAAFRNINRQHAQYSIRQDDYLYTLSTFYFEPIRWLQRYGYRPLEEKEKQALFIHLSKFGRLLGIRDIPETAEAFERFAADYERRHFHFAPSNREVGDATVAVMLGLTLPRFLWPLGRQVLYCLLDERVRVAFGYPAPPRWLAALVTLSLRLRARIRHWLPRFRPYRRTEKPTRSHPQGYRIEALGPPHTEQADGVRRKA